MTGHLLLTLVDHAKPFKGLWRIYKQNDCLYAACHSRGTTANRVEPLSCQSFNSTQQVCQFTEVLQFYGWSIDGQTSESLEFLQACAL